MVRYMLTLNRCYIHILLTQNATLNLKIYMKINTITNQVIEQGMTLDKLSPLLSLATQRQYV